MDFNPSLGKTIIPRDEFVFPNEAIWPGKALAFDDSSLVRRNAGLPFRHQLDTLEFFSMLRPRTKWDDIKDALGAGWDLIKAAYNFVATVVKVWSNRPPSKDRFVGWIADRIQEVDPKMMRHVAVHYGVTILDGLIMDEKVSYGDPAHSWTKTAARDLADEEISYWEAG